MTLMIRSRTNMEQTLQWVAMAQLDLTSVNPARPDDVVGRYTPGTAADVDRAVEAATAAQKEWTRVPVPARAEIIAAAGTVLAARKADLAHLVAREAGKILAEAGGDVQEAIDMATFVAGQGRSAWGTTVPSELGSKLCWTTRQPVGVVGLITPWNFPVAIPSWKIFPALLAGNGVVIKPSEHAPACCEAFVEACVAAGVPHELIQVVHGFAEPAAALATHPRVGAVSFTGSVPTGRKVAAAAMETGPRLVSLELGGKNAMIVRPDADLDLAVDGAVFGAFGTAGQRCTSTSRLVVHPDVAEQLVDRIVKRVGELVIGDPTDPRTDVGPVIDGVAGQRIAAMVEAAVGEGASVACGGATVDVAGCGGTFFAPTVLTGVRAEHHIAREEVFGPVLAVIEVADLDDAIEVVNGVEYGLSAAIYTRDVNTALAAVDAIDTGIVYVNAPTIGAEIPLPFGGTKHTGNGFREAGTRGIEQFSELKTVYVDYSGHLQKAQIDNRPPVTGGGAS
jgi:aldehyde dehydrogenase (NAD+)